MSTKSAPSGKSDLSLSSGRSASNAVDQSIQTPDPSSISTSTSTPAQRRHPSKGSAAVPAGDRVSRAWKWTCFALGVCVIFLLVDSLALNVVCAKALPAVPASTAGVTSQSASASASAAAAAAECPQCPSCPPCPAAPAAAKCSAITLNALRQAYGEVSQIRIAHEGVGRVSLAELQILDELGQRIIVRSGADGTIIRTSMLEPTVANVRYHDSSRLFNRLTRTRYPVLRTDEPGAGDGDPDQAPSLLTPVATSIFCTQTVRGMGSFVEILFGYPRRVRSVVLYNNDLPYPDDSGSADASPADVDGLVVSAVSPDGVRVELGRIAVGELPQNRYEFFTRPAAEIPRGVLSHKSVKFVRMSSLWNRAVHPAEIELISPTGDIYRNVRSRISAFHESVVNAVDSVGPPVESRQVPMVWRNRHGPQHAINGLHLHVIPGPGGWMSLENQVDKAIPLSAGAHVMTPHLPNHWVDVFFEDAPHDVASIVVYSQHGEAQTDMRITAYSSDLDTSIVAVFNMTAVYQRYEFNLV